MKKKFQVIIMLIVLAIFTQGFMLAATSTPDEIIGSYWSPNKDAKIEIYTKGHQYFGKFIG